MSRSIPPRGTGSFFHSLKIPLLLSNGVREVALERRRLRRSHSSAASGVHAARATTRSKRCPCRRPPSGRRSHDLRVIPSALPLRSRQPTSHPLQHLRRRAARPACAGRGGGRSLAARLDASWTRVHHCATRTHRCWWFFSRPPPHAFPSLCMAHLSVRSNNALLSLYFIFVALHQCPLPHHLCARELFSLCRTPQCEAHLLFASLQTIS